MKKLILIRHGESEWNKLNLFTGWTDVDLTEKGIADANQTGILLKEKGFHFDKAYTSFLKRAVKTLNCVLDKMDQDWIPVEKSWRLNEKHYGALQGLNKSETASKYGEEQVLIWRRSFNVAPNALPEDDPRNPKTDTRYKEVPDKDIWAYTGFRFEDILDPTAYPHTSCSEEYMNLIDVLVDGPYEEELRSPALKFRGSSNQRIIDVKKSIESNQIILVPIIDREYNPSL